MLACAATRSRSRRSDMDDKRRLPPQRVKNDAATSHPSVSSGPAISYTVHSMTRHKVRNVSAGPMVGGGGTRTRPPVLSPWGTGDRQPSDPSRCSQSGVCRLAMLLMQGTNVPEHRGIRQGRARQENGECGPTSLPRASWNVMPAATPMLLVLGSAAR